jgi:hypothetical protein
VFVQATRRVETDEAFFANYGTEPSSGLLVGWCHLCCPDAT